MSPTFNKSHFSNEEPLAVKRSSTAVLDETHHSVKNESHDKAAFKASAAALNQINSTDEEEDQDDLPNQMNLSDNDYEYSENGSSHSK